MRFKWIILCVLICGQCYADDYFNNDDFTGYLDYFNSLDPTKYFVNERFTNVFGQDEAKQKAREVVDFLKNPHIYTGLGAEIPRIITLRGPEGIGKKLLARAIAGEAQACFVPLNETNNVLSLCSDLLREKPVVVFAEGGSYSALEDYLAEIKKGVSGTCTNEIIFIRTKGLFSQGSLFRGNKKPKPYRAGEKVICIPDLDYNARYGLLQLYAKSITLDKALQKVVFFKAFAHKTEHFNAMHIKALVNQAAIYAAQDFSLQQSKHYFVRQKHFEQAYQALFSVVQQGSVQGSEAGRSFNYCYAEKTRFSHVVGVEKVIDEVKEFVEILRGSEMYKKVGVKKPKGLLLHGPPGVGKTLLARAIAGESKCCFISTSASQFVKIYVGSGPLAVRELFAFARMMAKSRPVILFFDELDSFGKRTDSGSGSQEYNNTINELLTQIDGFQKDENVFIIAATNNIGLVDEALLRAGRFDRKIQMDLPCMKDRVAILSYYLKKIALHKDLSVDTLASFWAKETGGYAGAGLENFVNEAALLAVRKGKDCVEAAHFEESFLRGTLGIRKDFMQTPLELEKTALHEAAHALISVLCGYEVSRVSILSRSQALGVSCAKRKHEVFSNNDEEDFRHTVMILLAGFCAERLVYKKVTSGVVSDLEKADTLLSRMVHSYGMSNGELAAMTSTCIRSERVLAEFDREMIAIKRTCVNIVERTLTKHMKTLLKLQRALIKHETLLEQAVYDIVGRPRKKPLATVD